MSAIYDLVRDYNSPDSVISMAPIWVLAVARWSHPFVFDRAAQTSSESIDAFEQAPEPVIIVSDCTSLSITGTKGSHVQNLTASLRDNNINYLSAIFPDDWLLAWILPNETRAKALVKKLRAGFPCNKFKDGLKFIGRVGTVFKDTAVDDAGKPSSIFSLTGAGFGEFDYGLFWEPKLVDNASLPVWFHRLGLALNSIVTGSDKSVTAAGDPNSIDVNKMIPALVRLTLGEGPFKNGNLAVPGGANASPNGGIRVPAFVGQWLGLVSFEGMTYSNMVDIVVGVQKYQGAAGAPQDSPLIFQPDGLTGAVIQFTPSSKNFAVSDTDQPATAEYQKTPIPLLGEFPIVQLPFQDTPIWQILEQFLNPGVNEMYVALKPDSKGNIFPRLTVRQYPFSTSKFAAEGSIFRGGLHFQPTGAFGNHGNLQLPANPGALSPGTLSIGNSTQLSDHIVKRPAVTTFLELPRWRIDPKMLKRIQVGRSNVLRSNFWNIQGTGPGTAISPSLQYVRSPPNTDKNDIERSGLRRVARTVNCLIKDATQGPDMWRDIITDVTAGQHLALTGTIIVVGIVSPIAPGDNVQFANVVYHVESVQHNCTMSADGKRDWKTTLQVSHGMADETTLEQNQQDTGLDSPLQEYAGVRNADPATIRIGRSVLDDFEKDL